MKTNQILMDNKVQRRKKSFRHYLSQIVNIHKIQFPLKMFCVFLYNTKKSSSLVDRFIS